MQSWLLGTLKGSWRPHHSEMLCCVGAAGSLPGSNCTLDTPSAWQEGNLNFGKSGRADPWELPIDGPITQMGGMPS